MNINIRVRILRGVRVRVEISIRIVRTRKDSKLEWFATVDLLGGCFEPKLVRLTDIHI